MENTKNVENAILENLAKLKQESSSGLKFASEYDEKETDKLIEALPNFNSINKTNLEFESKREYFDEVFFKHSKLLKINSKEHSDFWTFLRKYQALMKRKPPSNTGEKSRANFTCDYSPKFNLPMSYDKRYRLNFVYKPRRETFAAYDWQGRALKVDVTDDQMKEFELIIHLYLDFCQKEKVV